MNRRSFFRRATQVAGTAVIAPSLIKDALAAEPPPAVTTISQGLCHDFKYKDGVLIGFAERHAVAGEYVWVSMK